jgi:hypothetical protein
MPLLRPGDPFPQLTLTVPGGKTSEVPGWFAGDFGVMLFNRGHGQPQPRRAGRDLRRPGDGHRIAARGLAAQPGDRCPARTRP